MTNLLFETPEEFYQVLMSVRASGKEPPYVFVFSSEGAIKGFLDQCSDDDLERLTRNDVHVVIEYDGEYYRFTGLEDGQSSFEAISETVH